MTTEDKARTGTRWLVAAGLIAYGVVHLLVAWITLQIGWGGTSEEASPQGALQELAEKPFGGALLWAVAIGLFGLTLWRLSVLFLGDFHLSPAGRSVVYLALGIMAARVATGSGAGSRRQQQTLSARLMSEPLGRALVVLVGIAVLAIGVRHAWKALTKSFVEDLAGGVSTATIRLGQIGYAAKAVALAIACFGIYCFTWSRHPRP